MITNCKNCGAPLHNGVCDYCGTDYRDAWERYASRQLNFNIVPMKTDRLSCIVTLPFEDIEKYPEFAQDVIDKQIAGRFAEEIIKRASQCIDIETWIDPYTNLFRVGARLDVGFRRPTDEVI